MRELVEEMKSIRMARRSSRKETHGIVSIYPEVLKESR